MVNVKHLPVIVIGMGFCSLVLLSSKFLKNEKVITLKVKDFTQVEESSTLNNLPKIVLINDRNEESLSLDLPHLDKKELKFFPLNSLTYDDNIGRVFRSEVPP